jgi:hypothetical protein
MAFHFARFVSEVARRGKAEYPLPMYLNAALHRPGVEPGKYPSAGPVPHLLDIYEAAVGPIEMLCPDIYFFNFSDWLGQYSRCYGPLFVPEALRSCVAPTNALIAIARGAIGFSPFGIENPDPPALLAKTYGALRQLAPTLLEHQGSDQLLALAPRIQPDGSSVEAPQSYTVGAYTLTVSFDARPATGALSTQFHPEPATRGAELPSAGALLVVTAPDEYFVLGQGITIRHGTSGGDEQVGLLEVEEWAELEDGRWAPLRRLNGDQTHQGRHVRLPSGEVSLQRVVLYRYP